MVDFDIIKKGNEEIQKMIEEDPRLQEYQDEIQRRIKGQKPRNISAILDQMAMERRELLIEKLNELNNAAEKLAEIMKSIKRKNRRDEWKD